MSITFKQYLIQEGETEAELRQKVHKGIHAAGDVLDKEIARSRASIERVNRAKEAAAKSDAERQKAREERGETGRRSVRDVE